MDVVDEGALAVRCVVDVEMAGSFEVRHHGAAVEADVGPQPFRHALQARIDTELMQKLLPEGVTVLVATDVSRFKPGDVVTACPILENVPGMGPLVVLRCEFAM